jgi:hypothetical protein
MGSFGWGLIFGGKSTARYARKVNSCVNKAKLSQQSPRHIIIVLGRPCYLQDPMRPRAPILGFIYGRDHTLRDHI